MAGQIPAKVKRRRRERAMAEQHAVAREVSAGFMGRTIKVLVEAPANGKQLQEANVFSWEHGFLREASARARRLALRNFCVARGEADAPDIDGRVYVRGPLPAGEFATVRIIGHSDYDLIAEPAERPRGSSTQSQGARGTI